MSTKLGGAGGRPGGDREGLKRGKDERTQDGRGNSLDRHLLSCLAESPGCLGQAGQCQSLCDPCKACVAGFMTGPPSLTLPPY